jgi:WD40 repeat protein
MPLVVLDMARSPIRTAHFDPSSSRVVGAIFDGTARIWDASAPYLRWRTAPVTDNCGLVTSLEPDKRFLAIGCKEHPTRIWDAQEGKLLTELPSVTQVAGDFSSAYAAVSDLGDRAALARGNAVEVFAVPDGRLVNTIPHDAAVNAVAFSPNGDIVSGSIDGSVRVLRSNGARLDLPRSSEGIDAAAFLTNGRIVAADAGRRLRIYDQTGNQLAEFETNARVRNIRPSRDGKRLITVADIMRSSAAPELWDVEQYRRIAELAGETSQGETYAARFVDGKEIVTACGDGAVRRWSSTTGGLLRTYRGGARFFADATVTSSMVVAGGGDGSLRFWDLASGNSLWTMPAHRVRVIGLRAEGNDLVTRGAGGELSRWTLPDPQHVIQTWQKRERAILSR